MMRIPMSKAASALFRALLARADVPRDRILLTEYCSTDWQSLTLVGERHRLGLRMLGPDADATAQRISGGLEEAEFAIGRHIVAGIGLSGTPQANDDGSVTLEIEALTIEE